MKTTSWGVAIAAVSVGLLIAACDGEPGDEPGEPTSPGDPSAPAALPRGGSTRALAAGAAAPRAITLLTGHRVLVLGGGAYTVEPPRGGGSAGFRAFHEKGRLIVIPDEAAVLVAGGLLDPRLFDVTELLELRYDDSRRADLPLLVIGQPTARRAGLAALAAAGARVGRPLDSIGGAAARAPKSDVRAVWSALVTGRRGRAPTALIGGIRRIWLDGARKLSIDRSAVQIGAPAAWAVGLTGRGVTVAVLDTGIHLDHPDFAGRIAEARSFLDESPEPVDEFGHGTHVASILGGSGAAQGGQYRGIAPDVDFLVGRVCDRSGFCPESAILAGMEWAAAAGARVVNLSLGGVDTPALDPLEEAINTLTKEHGTLFVASAGNSPGCGGPTLRQVGSPGTAELALSVGAVDREDLIASFSCRGPRAGDGAVKPELTAPGVEIVAARAPGTDVGDIDPVGEFYTRASGTSMATPHVAGAAALLAQAHPTWRAAELKAALMAAARPTPSLSAFAQGAGRVDVARAIDQHVFTDPPSVNLGRAIWPHEDDALISRTVVYENRGQAPVALELRLEVAGPDGAAAPEGLFTVDPAAITVPAGDRAKVTITANTRVGGADGLFSGALVAGGGGQTVRTPLALDKEVESHQLELRFQFRDGAPGFASAILLNLDTGARTDLGLGLESLAARVPRGRYHIDVEFVGADLAGRPYRAVLVQPVYELTRPSIVPLDARAAEPVVTTVPEPSARRAFEFVEYVRVAGGSTWQLVHGNGDPGIPETDFASLYTAQIGPDVGEDELVPLVRSTWADPGPEQTFVDSPYAYHLSFLPQRGRFPTGFVRRLRPDELAILESDFASAGPGFIADVMMFPFPPEFPLMFLTTLTLRPPASRIDHLTTDVAWNAQLFEIDRDFAFHTLLSTLGEFLVRPGGRYRDRWNRAVLGPNVAFPADPTSSPYVSRRGNRLTLFQLNLHGDARGHFGNALSRRGRARIFRNGTLVRETRDPLFARVTVPPEPAEFRVEVEANRPATLLSTQVKVAWTFRSGETPADRATPLPVLSVQLAPPALDEFNRAPAGLLAVPLAVDRQPGAPAAPLATLDVEVSYDSGATWSPVLVTRLGDRGIAFVPHPPRDVSVSFRIRATDQAGNTVDQTILDGYRLRDVAPDEVADGT
jgi:hypothetical protein